MDYKTKYEEVSSKLRELFDILETVEESSFGREFHPTTIRSCRVMTQVKLAEDIIPTLKKHARSD